MELALAVNAWCQAGWDIQSRPQLRDIRPLQLRRRPVAQALECQSVLTAATTHLPNAVTGPRTIPWVTPGRMRWEVRQQ